MPLVQTSSQFGETGDDIDFGDVLRTLRRRWLIIALIAAVTTAIALYLVLVAPPKFTLNGTLYLGEGLSNQTNNSSSDTNFLADYQTVNSVDTQVQLLQSRALIEQAVLETGLNATVAPDGQDPILFWQWKFLDGGDVGAFAPPPGDVAVRFATLASPSDDGGTYLLHFGKAGHYRMYDSDTPSPDDLVLSGALDQPASGGGLSLAVSAVDRASPPADGDDFYVTISPAKEMADEVEDRLTVAAAGSSSDPTNVANIQFIWDDPYQGKLFEDQLMSDFIATQLSWQTESASNTEQFVAAELHKISASLAASNQNLAAYQSRTGIVDVPTNAQAVISQLSQYQVQRTTILLQQQALQQLLTATAQANGPVNPYVISQADDPVLSQLAGSLATAEISLQAQRVQFAPNAPEIQIQQATIGKTEGAIHTLIANDEAQATRGLANIDGLIKQYQDQLKTFPAQSLQVTDLTQASQVFGQLYVLLMQKDEEAEISKAATIVDTRIVSPAEIPLDATGPKAKVTVLAGLLLGLLAGTGLVLALRVLSGRFASAEEIRRLVPLPVYGVVPRQPRGQLARNIFPRSARGPFAEAFRLLRSNIYKSFDEAGGRVVLITSTAAADGKTVVAANLAKSLADDGRRVMLMDADLHVGRSHEALRMTPAPGLADWLAAKNPVAPRLVADQGFYVLTAGDLPPNPSEALNGPYLAYIFAALRAEFDYVVVDGPPLPLVTDSLTLAKYADLIISVLRVGHTARRAFTTHLDALGPREGQHVVVINGALGGGGQGRGYGEARGWAGMRQRFWGRG